MSPVSHAVATGLLAASLLSSACSGVLANPDAGFRANPDGGFPSGDCMRDSTTVAREIEQAIQATAVACSADSDCEVRSVDVKCVQGCALGVSRAQGPALDDELHRIEQEFCPKMTTRSAPSSPWMANAVASADVARD